MSDFSRRSVLGGVAAGSMLAAATATEALSQAQPPSGPTWIGVMLGFARVDANALPHNNLSVDSEVARCQLSLFDLTDLCTGTW